MTAARPYDDSRAQEWRSNATLATWLCALFIVFVAVAVGHAIAFGHRYLVLGDAHNGHASLFDVHNADDFVRFFAPLRAVLFLALAVVFIVWQWRSAKNAEQLRGARVERTAGWSIGGWFIPLANLVIPFRCVRNLRANAASATPAPDTAKRSPIPWWWGCFIAAGVLSTVASSIGSGDQLSYSEFRTRDAISALSVLVAAVAAVLAVAVVRSITTLQERAHGEAAVATPSEVSDAWIPAVAPAQAASSAPAVPAATSLPPAAWFPDPLARAELRYWDGNVWTPHVSTAGAVSYDDPGVAAVR